jgi:hypothetical protein
VKAAAIALLIALLACPTFSDETARGSLCIGPLPDRHPSPGLGSLCDSRNLSVQLDKREIVPWPRKASVKIEGIDLAESHLLVALCDGKPVQSTRFKFSEYNTDKLCLTFDELADGYEGLRLWNAKHPTRWKCK